ncbi:MAG: response regulator [Lewinella sp.]|nr:response regulator [Lewinella sp.]
MHQPIARLLIICLCFLSHLGVAGAQASRVDSLFAIWSDTTRSAAERVEAFYQRFSPLRNEQPNQEVARWAVSSGEALRLAREIGKEDYWGRLQMVESGYYLYISPDLEKGCALAGEAYHQSMETADYASAYYSLVFFLGSPCPLAPFAETGQDPYLLLSGAIDSVLTYSPVTEQVELFTMGGTILSFSQRYPEALLTLQTVLTIFAEAGIRNQSYLQALGFTGIIHKYIGNHEIAEQYFREELAGAFALRDTLNIGAAYIDIAESQLSLGNIPRAVAILDSAEQFTATRHDCEPCHMRLLRLKASIDNQSGNYQEALDKLLALLPYYQYEENNSSTNIGFYYAELGRAYLNLDRYREAVTAAHEGVKRMNGSIGSASTRNYRVLYEGYKQLGQYEQALTYYETYIQMRDSITRIRNGQLVTRLELQNQYEQQRLADSLQVEQKRLETELAMQGEINRQKSNRNIMLGLGLGALLLAIGLWQRLRFIRRTQKVLQEKNAQIEAEKEKAQASERAKHQFLANMSHEIRTPMNAVKGMTDILLRREPKQEQLEYLNGIKQSSDSLLVIINDILDLSKIEAGKVELEEVPFAVQEVVRNIYTIMRFKAEEKGLELLTSLPKDLPAVQGDPARLGQILVNLTGNAIKFTERGVVTITVREKAVSEQSVELQFTVSDTGIGIGEDRLDKIFSSFEQAYSDTSRKFGGTGLGLSISRKLVELQGGEIRVESQRGQGSQFHFTLTYPIASGEAAPAPVAALAEEATITLRGIRILLVEDNTFNAIVAREELEDAIPEVSVEVAENGAIAVEKLKAGTFDLVLMDVQMPVMNGYEATEKIRSLANGQPTIPIIAMTANVLKEEVERCFAAGMDDFIGKPFSVDDLLGKMAQLLS